MKIEEDNVMNIKILKIILVFILGLIMAGLIFIAAFLFYLEHHIPAIISVIAIIIFIVTCVRIIYINYLK